MKLLDRIFTEPDLVASPPVLIDIGAAGGVPKAWLSIARYAVVVAFEPDAREAAPLSSEKQKFLRCVVIPALALSKATVEGKVPFHLTRSPQCSSVLKPCSEALAEWAFADFFKVEKTPALPAVNLMDALQREGITRVDWLKCDTQGTDLTLHQSLSAEIRDRLIATDFEPGIIDAYEGEDKLAQVLAAMEREPVWLSRFDVGGTVRARARVLEQHFGASRAQWIRRLGTAAPAWANLGYLRDITKDDFSLDRRAYLLTWVFATMQRQHGYALAVGEEGAKKFGGPLFAEMQRGSVAALRSEAWRRFPVFAVRYFFGRK